MASQISGGGSVEGTPLLAPPMAVLCHNIRRFEIPAEFVEHCGNNGLKAYAIMGRAEIYDKNSANEEEGEGDDLDFDYYGQAKLWCVVRNEDEGDFLKFIEKSKRGKGEGKEMLLELERWVDEVWDKECGGGENIEDALPAWVGEEED